MTTELAANTKLSHYHILAKIGSGGMGEVYLAEDARLDRKVAIKVLPADFAKDEDRLRRFEQEAKATSALNHPNILTVHDIGEHDGNPFIVSELLDGEELRQRLDEGPIPLRKAVEYAQQIVSGLSAAHEKGIVHRDLKPENLFITKDDRVKILDFGLAKLSEPVAVASGSEDHTRKALTNPGVVMGTVGYMSPEQVRGQMTDHRSDIFSFGLILYEMITGRRAFQHETMAETMSAILKEEPEEITESHPAISPSLDRIVRRCLEKKPERRFQTASDLGFALESLSAPTSASGGGLTMLAAAAVAETERSSWRPRIPWIVAAAAVLVALTVLAAVYIRRPIPDERLVRFEVSIPDSSSEIRTPVISPDGRIIVYVAMVEGKRYLYIRALDSMTEQRINGSEGASSPFWSPDSRYIGFFAIGKLKKADVNGGPVQVLCDAGTGTGGAWNRDGVILFGMVAKGIHRVSSAGGEATELLPVDASRKESEQDFPSFLPDGRHFFYYSWNGSSSTTEIFVASIDGRERKSVLKNDSNVAYVSPGFLLFARGTTLMAQPFDTNKLQLSGDPVPVVESVAYSTSDAYSNFSVSENGTMLYLSGGAGARQLTWFDRQGKAISPVGPPGSYNDLVLSPDGKRAATQRTVDGNSDIWIIDLVRGLPLRFTFAPTSEDDPAWSSDGNSLLFTSDKDGGGRKIFRKIASGAGNEEAISDEVGPVDDGIDWSPDGKNIIYEVAGEKTSSDLWVLAMTGGAKPYPLLQSEFSEFHGRFSPDGRYFAYVSTESGRPEVYVQSFPPAGGKWQISTEGGAQPHWRRDGKELFYLSADRKMMAVEVKLEGSFDSGVPTTLFQTLVSGFTSPNRYDVSADGQRFLVNSAVEEASKTPISLVLNWASTLKK
jgi:serine/threonine protein kinase/Tol biopolymer transport system component